ncbi:hypothetical protein [Apibacter adventoris]|uniref:hypothetical protein n=1 Tax=Apibacter adventoris TaxID=1679466 RepID=UPI000CF70308|nr:hypothetical protein [Apibacter adventoris]PQL94683.1 hypothetical protein C4S76_04420 [Apibacter adventoris]
MKNINKTTIERLVEFMEYKNLNDNKITSIAGLSVGLIGRARKNNSGLHSDTIEKILTSFPELNPTWLLTGKGNMLNKESEKNVINNNEENLIDDIFDTQRDILAFLKKNYTKKIF